MPYISQVIFGDQIKMDLTNDTATPETVLEGYTFHAANGEPCVGTASQGQSFDYKIIRSTDNSLLGTTGTINEIKTQITPNDILISNVNCVLKFENFQNENFNNFNAIIYPSGSPYTTNNWGNIVFKNIINCNLNNMSYNIGYGSSSKDFINFIFEGYFKDDILNNIAPRIYNDWNVYNFKCTKSNHSTVIFNNAIFDNCDLTLFAQRSIAAINYISYNTKFINCNCSNLFGSFYSGGNSVRNGYNGYYVDIDNFYGNFYFDNCIVTGLLDGAVITNPYSSNIEITNSESTIYLTNNCSGYNIFTYGINTSSDKPTHRQQPNIIIDNTCDIYELFGVFPISWSKNINYRSNITLLADDYRYNLQKFLYGGSINRILTMYGVNFTFYNNINCYNFIDNVNNGLIINCDFHFGSNCNFSNMFKFNYNANSGTILFNNTNIYIQKANSFDYFLSSVNLVVNSFNIYVNEFGTDCNFYRMQENSIAFFYDYNFPKIPDNSICSFMFNGPFRDIHITDIGNNCNCYYMFMNGSLQNVNYLNDPTTINIGNNCCCAYMFSGVQYFNKEIIFKGTDVYAGDLSGFITNCYWFDKPINIPNNVIYMARSFYGCRNFNQPVNIPNTVKYMRQAFAECDNLGCQINIPNGLIDFYEAFKNCARVKISNVNLLDVNQNMNNAFYRCTNLDGYVVLPLETNVILNNAFRYCTNLKRIYIMDDVINNFNYSKFIKMLWGKCEGIQNVWPNRIDIYLKNNDLTYNFVRRNPQIIDVAITYLNENNVYYNATYNIYISAKSTID